MFLFAMALAANNLPEVAIQSDFPVYWTQGDWTVYSFKDEGSCDLGYREANNEYLTIAFDAKEKAMSLLVTNKDASSLEDGQTVLLNVFFTKKSKIADSWNPIEFTARRIEGQNPVLASGLFSSVALEDFEKNDAVAVMTKANHVVSYYRLQGSSKAIEQLRKCGAEIAGINPNDPFMK